MMSGVMRGYMLKTCLCNKISLCMHAHAQFTILPFLSIIIIITVQLHLACLSFFTRLSQLHYTEHVMAGAMVVLNAEMILCFFVCSCLLLLR